MTQPSNQKPPGPAFGLTITTSLVVGTMIGSGIFLLPASLAPFGSSGLYGWLLTSLGALALAWVFAKLSHWSPGLGGPYHYTRVGVGEFPAFLVAWGYWISIWTGNAAVAVTAVSYSKHFLPQLEQSGYSMIVLALGYVWLFGLINIRGVQQAGRVQLITSLLKVVPLLVFGVIGLFYISPENFIRSEPNQSNVEFPVIAAAALWLWAFLGVESASIPSDSIREPSKTIPRATVIGVAIVAIVYLFGFCVVYGVLSPQEIANSNAPFADAASTLWGDWSANVIAVVAVISTLGALNGLILLGGQMPMAAARDGLFPGLFAKQNAGGSPGLGIALSSTLTSVLVLMNFSDNLLQVFNFAILLSTTALLVAYLFCSAAAFRLQINRADRLKSGSLLVIAFAFLFSIWAVAGAGQEAVYWGFILMMCGLPVYTVLKIIQDRGAI